MLNKFGLLSILFVIIIISFLVMNLGSFFDITKKPEKTDVIVCLGGGGIERLTKSLDLYLKGYSKSDKLVLTGTTKFNKKENKIAFFMRHGIPREKIIFLKGTSNTMYEVLILKNYLLKNNMKNVTFITDPPHSRRIIFLANTIAKYTRDGLSCFVVGSDVAWWNKESYYDNNKAIRFVISELLKLPFNYIVYGIIKPLGLYEPLKENIGGLMYFIKHNIQRLLV